MPLVFSRHHEPAHARVVARLDGPALSAQAILDSATAA
jgi:hypothetical protein